MVSNLGRIMTHGRTIPTKRGKGRTFPAKIIKNTLTSRGYMVGALYSIDRNIVAIQVHRVVATAFISDPPSSYHQVNHINGVKTDNRACNLEWVTPSENTRHAIKTGLIKKRFGSKVGGSVLNEGDVINLLKRINSGERQCDLSREFGISPASICDITSGRTWAWLTGLPLKQRP